MPQQTWLVALDPLRGATGTRAVQNLGGGLFWDLLERRSTSAVCFGLPARLGSHALWIVKDLLGGWARG